MYITKAILVLLLIQLVFNYSHGQPRERFYRKDYDFLDDTQGFYKIHTIHRTWQDAKKRCQMEGASLYYPEDEIEADAVQALWAKKQPQFDWVFVGISDLLANGVFETIDGRPILDVFSNWRQGEPNDYGGKEDCVVLNHDKTINDEMCDKKFPFICKKSLLDVEWNILCDMPYQGYVFNKDLDKCYKFHLTPMNWADAHAFCSVEQSYLAIINTQAEADYLVKITEEAPKSKVKGNFLCGAVHLGYHNRDDDGWKTIKGEDWGIQKAIAGAIYGEARSGFYYNVFKG